MPRYSGFVGPSYVSQSIVAADDRTVNLIPSQIESGTGAGGVQYVFDPGPGLSLLVNTGITGFCRASYSVNLAAYMVIGTKLVQVFVVPTPTFNTLVDIGGTGQASVPHPPPTPPA